MNGYLVRHLVRNLTMLAVLVALTSLVAAPAQSNAVRQSLSTGQSLAAGDRLVSPSGQYSAQLSHGNLIIFRLGFGTIWSSSARTADPGTRVVLQDNGELVLRTAKNAIRWSSGISGISSPVLKMQDNGNLVVFSSSGSVAWHSNSQRPKDRTDRLPSGAAIMSPDNSSKAVMQPDGNLVVYHDGKAVWSSQTKSEGARAVVTPGLGLVVLSLGNRILWSTATTTDYGSTLRLGNDGKLALSNSASTIRWASQVPAPPPPVTPVAPATMDCNKVTGPVVVGDTTVVRGIRVHKCIAEATTRMVDDAAKAGVKLAGTGWRDNSRQIALRIQNCGGDDYYSVYVKPSGQCTPPTAIPGRSMHERGLAIDFNVNGRAVVPADPQFKWLKANAARYGYYNLPSESWHWSTNGS